MSQLRSLSARGSIDAALSTAAGRLLAELSPQGCWRGKLSSSALSTATATSALAVAQCAGGGSQHAELIAGGRAWLCGTQNADGGWGDTADSPSNLATTMLCAAALHIGGRAACAGTLDRAAGWIRAAAGGRDLAEAISSAYGRDRTFAVPILVNCALAGLMPWERIPRLPFELAVLPQGWYRFLRLHVVSYALPALIAIGVALDERRPPAAPVRALRGLARKPALRKLQEIQPSSGGFLEAVPLTSFVAMSLAPAVGPDDATVARCLEFIRRSARPDGSWAIDSDLSMWVTTNSVKALIGAGALPAGEGAGLGRWIAAGQHRSTHPYTGAEAGGWAWTDLPGGVPDVDYTASAVLALSMLGEAEPLAGGVRWLLRIQNSDGGWPTFCRGWGRLPFDRSSPDLAAHALRALHAAAPLAGFERPIARATRRGLAYLRRSQRPDGSWVPLWFGNQHVPGMRNPVLGTSLVLRCLELLDPDGAAAARGADFLARAQNLDGGWGGGPGAASTTEETALAVAALAGCRRSEQQREAALRGALHLAAKIGDGSWTRPSAIGLYFANLWYSERLYPMIWTVEAMGRVARSGLAVSTIPGAS